MMATAATSIPATIIYSASAWPDLHARFTRNFRLPQTYESISGDECQCRINDRMAMGRMAGAAVRAPGGAPEIRNLGRWLIVKRRRRDHLAPGQRGKESRDQNRAARFDAGLHHGFYDWAGCGRCPAQGMPLHARTASAPRRGSRRRGPANSTPFGKWSPSRILRIHFSFFVIQAAWRCCRHVFPNRHAANAKARFALHLPIRHARLFGPHCPYL